MSDNSILLRTTTIGLDEYNTLKTEKSELRERIGAQDQTIRTLKDKIEELKIRQPEIKVTHFTQEYETSYNDWDDEIEIPYKQQRKVEFVNMTDVTNLAKKEMSKAYKEEIDELKSKVKGNDYLIKSLRENIDTLQERIDTKERQLQKAKVKNKEEVEDLKEAHDKFVKDLKKAYENDTKAYTETIDELREEIQKVKDSKTDAEVEEKRNKEIKDLKGRIKDLEGVIEDLGSMNFFKRVFKLKTISAERLAAQTELLERERRANNVGTTWVKENGKYRKYNSFSEFLNNVFTINLGNTWHVARGWF